MCSNQYGSWHQVRHICNRKDEEETERFDLFLKEMAGFCRKDEADTENSDLSLKEMADLVCFLTCCLGAATSMLAGVRHSFDLWCNTLNFNQ